MEKLKDYKLGEVANVTKLAGYEFTKYVKYIPNGEIIAIRALNLRDGQLDLSDTQKISREVSDELERSKLFKNEIVLSYTGTIGACSIITENDKFHLAPNVCKITPSSSIDPYYLFYIIRSEKFQNQLLGYAHGSTQPTIPMKTIREIPISLCDYNKQHIIGLILKSFDDKIEVNRRINDNLEQQAQALYKSWFIDFAPFKNGRFIESELGMIPEGWRVGQLSDIGEIVGGSTPSKAKPEYYTDNGIAWITPKDLSISKDMFTSKGETDITEEGYQSCSAKLMPKGAVLFSSRAPIGYIAIAKNKICTNQGFKSVIPTIAGTSFIYYFLKSKTKEIENKATGSTFKEASGSLMKSIQLAIPPKEIFDKFENMMTPFLKSIELFEDESRRLAILRDTLLPRLMSGNIHITDM